MSTNEDARMIAKKLHMPLTAANPQVSAKFMQGGYNQPGYGVPAKASIDGSFAVGSEGNQGYYVDGGKEIFISTVESMKDLFKKRAKILGRKIRYVIKPGIGGQHTPFQGIASAFQVIDGDRGLVIGEYELGKDYESAMKNTMKKLGAGWNEIIIIPSSKSGSTDETMLIFSDLFYIILKNVAIEEGFDGRLFADTIFRLLHEVNFKEGKELSPKDLFKDFNLSKAAAALQAKGASISYEQVKKIFGAVLGNMFFETTDRPEQSRLSAFIRNSGLDKELGSDAPGFGAMFDNVGGRWTADLHMMTFLAYYDLDASAYWSARIEGIKKVREGKHRANALAENILSKGIKDIALVVPDGLFWFGKAMEQNFNESIWQKGFANLIAVKAGAWKAQESRYSGKPDALVINISGLVISQDLFNVAGLGEFNLKCAVKQELANSLGELFTTFYGMTHIVGNTLIARALLEKGHTTADIDLNDLDDPKTRIVQQNLYLRQPYVELGKGLLENKLKTLQAKGAGSIEEEFEKIKRSASERQITSNAAELKLPANINGEDQLKDVVVRAVKLAKKEGRKFVPFIYLEGDKFIALREHLVNLGVEWVMQGTGDQHISYQQVLAQPQRYLPFIISFVPKNILPGRPAIGFAKGYLDNVSPNMVRDLFAEASYKALVEPRNDEAGEKVSGAKGLFLRITDTDDDRGMLARSFMVY